MDRREFLEKVGILGAAAAACGWETVAGAAEGAPKTLPRIKLGSLEVSRLILGTNPFGGWAHKPGDIGKEMKAYYTDERIMATLEEAAECGITAVAGPPDEWWTRMYKRYLDGGGKLRTWIAQPHKQPPEILDEMKYAVDWGAKAIFIQGHKVEDQFEKGTFDVVVTWIELIHKLGVPAGIAAHRQDVHLEAQKRGFPNDFYFQCMYNVAHGDSFEKGDPAKAAEVIQKLEKPVVAYKILGAGRVPAKEGFEFAFKSIRAKDGVCVGVYTKGQPQQIREDSDLARKLS